MLCYGPGSMSRPVGQSCQVDLVRDNGHRYFLEVLANPHMPAQHRTMAAFVLATMVRNYRAGQKAALQGSLIPYCVEQMDDPSAPLRWVPHGEEAPPGEGQGRH